MSTQGFASAGDLPEELKQPLGSVLLALADNKRLLGMRYSEWILGAPTLEAGIACSAMAQDEWGHGRIVYAMLKGFGYDPAELEHGRQGDAYHCSELLDQPAGSWPEVLALNLLLDTALSVQFEGMRAGGYEPMHYKAKKLLDEERFHLGHGRGWTARLAETEAGRGALTEAFRPAWESCLRWFGSPDGTIGDLLSEHGVVRGSPAELRSEWLGQVGPAVHAAGLGLVEPDGDRWSSTVEPDWTDWDGQRRRVGTGGPDDATLAGVRGDKNRAMLLD